MTFILVWLIQSSAEWLFAIGTTTSLNQLMCSLCSDAEWVAVESWLWIWNGFGGTIGQHDFIIDWA